MEISFIYTALRRYLWLVALGVTLGNLAGTFVAPEPVLTYRSSAAMVISPPSSASSPFLQASQLDRYVSTQLSYLTSRDVAEAVAERFDDGLTADAVTGIIAVEPVPESDIVTVTATADDPERAQEISQTYAETYLDLIQADLEANQERNLSELDGRIAVVEANLRAVNARLAEAVRPYLEDFNEAASEGLPTQPVPQPSQVDPGAAVEQTTLAAELGQLRAQRNDLEFDRAQMNSAITQQATLPTVPESSSSGLYQTAGIVVGLLVGLIAALLAAQLSPRVLDAIAVGDILGVPVVAEVDRRRKLVGRPDLALKSLGSNLESVVDQICVRADGMAPVDRAGLVAVASAEPGGGATTVALAMASRFSARGYRTVVVDLDVLHPYINEAFGAWLEPTSAARSVDGAFSGTVFHTNVDGLRVMATSTEADAATVRRDSIDELIVAASRDADVVIFDVGSAVDSAFASRLASRVDAFVLCIALQSQKTNRLLDVGSRLAEAGGRLLPVITSPARRSANASKAQVSSNPVVVDGPVRQRAYVGAEVIDAEPYDDRSPTGSDPDLEEAKSADSNKRSLVSGELGAAGPKGTKPERDAENSRQARTARRKDDSASESGDNGTNDSSDRTSKTRPRSTSGRGATDSGPQARREQ